MISPLSLILIIVTIGSMSIGIICLSIAYRRWSREQDRLVYNLIENGARETEELLRKYNQLNETRRNTK